MSLASDLMGLGVKPLEAQRTANAGVGPVLAAATGSASAANGYKIGGDQYITYFTTGASANSAVLPAIGGDTGPLYGDQFVIHNSSATALNLYTPAGVTLNVVGSVVTSTSPQSVVQYHTLNCWVASSVVYFGFYT